MTLPQLRGETKMKLTTIIRNGLLKTKLELAHDSFKHYEGHANHFLKWASQNISDELSDFTEADLIDYISFMKLTCSNRTLNIRIGNLRRLFERAKVNTDMFKEIGKFKETKKTFNMLTELEIKKIRKYAYSLNPDILNNLMHQAVILLLMETGVRRTELIKIEKKNINLKENEILLTHTKSKVDRVVYFKKSTIPIIELLLKEKTNHHFLLHNRLANRPANTDDITYIISKKLKRELKIKKIHPHMFRHSFGTMMVDAGIQLYLVQELMGHEDISTTEIYLHSSKIKKKIAYEKLKLD